MSRLIDWLNNSCQSGVDLQSAAWPQVHNTCALISSVIHSWPCWELIVSTWTYDHSSVGRILFHKAAKVEVLEFKCSAWTEWGLHSKTRCWLLRKVPWIQLALWELRSVLQFGAYITPQLLDARTQIAIWAVATWSYSHAVWHCNSVQCNVFINRILDQSSPTVTGGALQRAFCAMSQGLDQANRNLQIIHFMSSEFISSRHLHYPKIGPL